MIEDILYWENIVEQRQADIDCQNDINNPDRELMNILLTQLEEAQTKIKELDG
jgi:hypothetical protein|tara:strand:- start:434 stop:592 length:159 start_codon:yes stop_codon:yes gene_type:complete